MTRPIHVVRDGRDVMVSAYYYFLMPSDHTPSALTASWRQRMPFDDYHDIKANLGQFIKIFNQYYKVGNKAYSWQDHTKINLLCENSIMIKYEELLKDPHQSLLRVLDHLGHVHLREQIDTVVKKYEFKNVSNRNRGEEDISAFQRKGIAGDWVNHFTTESLSVFYSYGTKELSQIGYSLDTQPSSC